jgi:hypothetical protein
MTNTAENKLTFKIIIPEDIAESDMIIASATKGDGKTGRVSIASDAEGNIIVPNETALYTPRLNSIYWIEQQKQKERDGNMAWATIDKYLLCVSIVNGPVDGSNENSFVPLYIMADLFYDQDTNTYIAKALGSYSSLAKVVAVNIKNRGKIIAERHFTEDGVGKLTNIVIADANLEKRAIPLFFWLQLNEIFT